MSDRLIPRIGTFFILLGLGLIALFIGSAVGGTPKFELFFISLIIFFIAFLFRCRASPPSASVRFGSLRGLAERRRRKKEEQQELQQQKR